MKTSVRLASHRLGFETGTSESEAEMLTTKLPRSVGILQAIIATKVKMEAKVHFGFSTQSFR